MSLFFNVCLLLFHINHLKSYQCYADTAKGYVHQSLLNFCWNYSIIAINHKRKHKLKNAETKVTYKCLVYIYNCQAKYTDWNCEISEQRRSLCVCIYYVNRCDSNTYAMYMFNALSCSSTYICKFHDLTT